MDFYTAKTQFNNYLKRLRLPQMTKIRSKKSYIPTVLSKEKCRYCRPYENYLRKIRPSPR
mgnify:CR=1 FL=1